MPEGFLWEIPPLDGQDQRLVEAYRLVGRPVDTLPYTADFRRLCELVSAPDSDDARHLIYRRLLNLRKSGRLPSLGLLVE